MTAALFALFVGSILHLDRTAVAQTLLHRPIAVGGILGFIGGFPILGALVGIVLEFIALYQPPSGSDLPQDETAITIIAMVATMMHTAPPEQLLPIAIGFALPAGAMARELEHRCRHMNRLIQQRVELSGTRLEQNLERSLWLAIVSRWLLTVVFLASGVVVVSSVLYAITLTGLTEIFGDWGGQLLVLLPLAGVSYELFQPGWQRRWKPLLVGALAGVGLWVVIGV